MLLEIIADTKTPTQPVASRFTHRSAADRRFRLQFAQLRLLVEHQCGRALLAPRPPGNAHIVHRTVDRVAHHHVAALIHSRTQCGRTTDAIRLVALIQPLIESQPVAASFVLRLLAAQAANKLIARAGHRQIDKAHVGRTRKTAGPFGLHTIAEHRTESQMRHANAACEFRTAGAPIERVAVAEIGEQCADRPADAHVRRRSQAGRQLGVYVGNEAGDCRQNDGGKDCDGNAINSVVFVG